MKEILWYIKQLVPLTYASDYFVDGKHYVSYWKMWFGRTYQHHVFLVERKVTEKEVWGEAVKS